MRTILISSNGALSKTSGKVVTNITEDLPATFRKLTGIVFDGQVWYDTAMRLHGSDTVKLAYKATKGCNVFGCYTAANAQTNYSLYISTSSGGKYMRYNGGTYNSDFATNTRYDVTITPTGTDGMRTDSTWTEKTFTTESDMLIGSTSTGATSARFTGTMYGNLEVVGRAVWVPAERVADGEIGYYDIYTDTFITNQGTGTPTALGYAS